MSRNPLLLAERNAEIKKQYQRLEDEKVHGVQKYRYEAILHILSRRFFLAPMTIKEILLTDDEPTTQLNMFE